MVITIPVKPKKPSNKNKTTGQTASQSAPEAPAKGPHPNSIIPFIDRISVALTIPVEQDAVDIYETLIATVTDKEVLKPTRPKGMKGHKSRAWRIILPELVDSKKWPFFQCDFDPSLKLAVRLRIEFNAIDLGANGVHSLHLTLISLVPDGWGFFIKHGRVSALEVTADIPGVGMEDFHVLPAQGVHSATYRRNGKLQTLYLGKSTGSQTRIYDRGEKRVAKGQDWAGPLTVRVERKLKLGTVLSLPELAHLSNPFKGIKIVAYAPGCPPEEVEKHKDYLWMLFLDCARVRNLNAALQLLPEKKQATYRKWLAQFPQSWWDSKAIWKHWPKVVEETLLSSKSLT